MSGSGKPAIHHFIQYNTLCISLLFPFPIRCLHPVFSILRSFQNKPFHIQPLPIKPDKRNTSLLRKFHHQPMLRLSRFVGAGPPACPISPVPIHRKRGAEFFIFHTVRRHLHPRQPGQILPIKSPGRILLRFFNQIIPPQPKNRHQKQDCQQYHTPYFKSFPHTIFPFLFYLLFLSSITYTAG